MISIQCYCLVSIFIDFLFPGFCFGRRQHFFQWFNFIGVLPLWQCCEKLLQGGQAEPTINSVKSGTKKLFHQMFFFNDQSRFSVENATKFDKTVCPHSKSFHVKLKIQKVEKKCQIEQSNGDSLSLEIFFNLRKQFIFIFY